MRSRQRKLIGTVFMVLFVVVYALVAMVLAQMTALKVSSEPIPCGSFAALGLGWAVPADPAHSPRWSAGTSDRRQSSSPVSPTLTLRPPFSQDERRAGQQDVEIRRDPATAR